MKFCVVDVETTGLSPIKDKLHGVGIAFEEDTTVYNGAWELSPEVVDVLGDPNVAKVGHRIRFDLKFLARAGLTVRGPIYCTKIMAHLINENDSTGLKDLAEKHLGSWALEGKRELDAAISRAGVKGLEKLHALDLADPAHPYFSVISKYCQEDCNNTLKLYYILKEKLKEIARIQKEKLGSTRTVVDYYLKESMPLENVLMKMELQGISVNPKVLEEIRNETVKKQTGLLEDLNHQAASEIITVEETLFQKALDKRKSPTGKQKVQRDSDQYDTKFNWDSGPHLGQLLKLSVKELRTTTSGKVDTSEMYLRFLQQTQATTPQLKETLKTFASYKKTTKTLSTYLDGVSSHVMGDKVFAEYDPFIVTGRLSSMRPNLQNLSRESGIKKFFTTSSKENVFLYCDYSQIELRVAAHVSQDETMMEVFKDDLDPHIILAEKIFGEKIIKKDPRRQVGKTANFLLIYKGSAMRLQQELKDKNGLDYTLEDCKAFSDAYFKLYPGYVAYINQQLDFMRKFHRVVAENGRVRRLPDIVFGQYLDWRNHRFTGPAELRAKLEGPNEEEIFWAANKKFSHAKKQGLNFGIQGLAASICKKALIDLNKAGFDIKTTVHDSIVIELPITQLHRGAEARALMENAWPLSVPTPVDFKLLTSLHEESEYEPDANIFLTTGKQQLTEKVVAAKIKQ